VIRAVGVGPGDPDLLTVKAWKLIEAADVVVGFASVLGVVRDVVKGRTVTLTYANQVDALAEVAAAHRAGDRCVVCFMGDPNFSGYQLLERVEQACGERIEIVPGVSAAQIAACRARTPFDTTAFVSFHKRGDLERDMTYLREAVRGGRAAIVIPRPWDFMPEAIAGFLIAQKIPPRTAVTVFERLTTEETEWHGTLEDLSAGVHRERFSDMSILVVRACGGPAERHRGAGPEIGGLP